VLEVPSENEGFRGVSLKAELLQEIEQFLKDFPSYRSVAEFISEASRLRMEVVRQKKKRSQSKED
jgi:metal-responsive CopG/Arc/MetJ family transcriptional regulator